MKRYTLISIATLVAASLLQANADEVHQPQTNVPAQAVNICIRSMIPKLRQTRQQQIAALQRIKDDKERQALIKKHRQSLREMMREMMNDCMGERNTPPMMRRPSRMSGPPQDGGPPMMRKPDGMNGPPMMRRPDGMGGPPLGGSMPPTMRSPGMMNGPPIMGSPPPNQKPSVTNKLVPK